MVPEVPTASTCSGAEEGNTSRSPAGSRCFGLGPPSPLEKEKKENVFVSSLSSVAITKSINIRLLRNNYFKLDINKRV